MHAIARFALRRRHRYAEEKKGERMTEHHSINPNRLRDHLANERTLLAWVRTSITIAGLGFVVAKFGILLREVGGKHVHPLTAESGAIVGVSLVLSGVVTAALATFRFLRTQRDIERDVVRFSPVLDVLLAGLFSAIGIVLAVYLLATS
jgi:putative membrane protein